MYGIARNATFNKRAKLEKDLPEKVQSIAQPGLLNDEETLLLVNSITNIITFE